MIGYLPVALPEETLPSFFRRYYLHTFAKSYSKVARELLGHHEIPVSAHFQFHADRLAENTKHILGLNAAQILDRFTLIRLYQQFLSVERQEIMRRSLEGGDGGKTGAAAVFNGITRGFWCPQVPKICPLCAREQLALYGETYFVRVHQIPFVYICPIHHCDLLDVSNSDLDRLRFAREFFAGDINIGQVEYVNYETHDIVGGMARTFAGLLDGTLTLDMDYRRRLQENGYFTGTFCQLSILKNKFEEYYQPVRSLYIDPCLRTIGRQGLISSALINEPGKITNPLRNVLFSFFLDHGPKGARVTWPLRFHDRHLFGRGPWPCRNKVCGHFKKLVVRGSFHFTGGADGRTLGRFSCPFCEMRFVMSFKRKGNEWRKLFTVLDYGTLWKNELKRLVKKAAKRKSNWGCKQDLAFKLGVDASTVRYQAAKLGLNVLWTELEAVIPKRSADKKAQLVAQRRKEFLGLIGKFPTRGEFMRVHRTLADWLRRCDEEWFLLNLTRAWPKKRIVFRDYAKKDKELLEIIQNKYNELIKNNLPTQITKTTVLKLAGVTLNQNKFPLTNEFLVNGVETLEAYRNRRLDNVLKQIDWSKKNVSRGIFIKASIIKPNREQIRRVQAEIVKHTIK